VLQAPDSGQEPFYLGIASSSLRSVQAVAAGPGSSSRLLALTIASQPADRQASANEKQGHRLGNWCRVQALIQAHIVEIGLPGPKFSRRVPEPDLQILSGDKRNE
jgi:hypothetical protein